MNHDISDLIYSFEPIRLEAMDRVKLMDRVDTKYVFPFSRLPHLLQEMRDEYRLLDINNIRMHRYESLYYDTPGFYLYARHQSGKLNRYKFRFRTYVDSGGLTYFEIKFKNNKERTIKERVKLKEAPMELSGKVEQFLTSTTPYSPQMLEPKIWVNYSRMTFVNKYSQERLTVDTNLHYIQSNRKSDLTVRFPQMVIAEAKRDKVSSVSKFIRLVRQMGVREGAISKYCFGVYNLFQNVKKNNFKPRVRFIHKMSHTQSALTGS